MTLLSNVKDFFDGLSRGLGLFVFERNDMTQRTTAPRLVRDDS